MDSIYLKDMAEISAGQGAPQKEEHFGENGYPFIRAGSMDLLVNGASEGSLEKIDDKTAKNHGMRLFPAGSILFAKSGMSAMKDRVYVLKSQCYVANHLAVIIPKDNIDSIFLKYWFTKYRPSNLIQDSAYPSIRLSDIGSVKIPKYSHEYKLKIATWLEKADSARQKRKEAIKLADEFLKSVFIEIFGDPVRNPKKWRQLKGEECCKKISVGVVVKPASHYVSIGVVALRSQNIKANRIDLTDIVYFSKEAHNGILSKSILKTGDVVVVRTGSTGTAAVVTKGLDGANCIDLIICRTKTDLINPFYLSFLLNSERGKWLVSSREVGGIQKHFNIGALNGMKIPVPPISLQNEFLKALNFIESLKQKMLAQSEELDNLFNSLMQRVFGG